MTKFTDFFISVFLILSILAASFIFVADGIRGYDVEIEDSNAINISKINKTLSEVSIITSTLQSEETGLLAGLETLIKRAFSVVKLLGGVIGIMYDLFNSFLSDYGVDPIFGRIFLGVITIIFVFLAIALLTGRFL